MDPFILQVMIFVVVILVVVGGFAMLFPLTRQLTAILEKRYIDDGEGANADEVAALHRAVHALRGEVEQIGERQDFTEKLLERPKSED